MASVTVEGITDRQACLLLMMLPAIIRYAGIEGKYEMFMQLDEERP